YYAGGPIRLKVVSRVYDLALSPDKSLIAAGVEDGSIRLWDINNDWEMHTLDGHSGAVTSVYFTPDGNTLISTGRDGTLRMWDVSSRQVLNIQEVSENALNNASMALDGSLLATIGEDGIVHTFDVASGQLIQSLGPSEGTKLAVAVNADGSLVAAGDGADIQIWDARTGQRTQRLEGYWEDETQEQWLGHQEDVTALVFSPDDQLLVSGSSDKQITFWDLETGEAKWLGEGHFGVINELEFDQEGKNVHSASADYKARIWQVPGGRSSDTFVGHLSAVNTVANGPQANTFITGGDDGSVRLWDITNTSMIHIEWSERGVQYIWGELFSIWMILSGILGLVCLWGLWKGQIWSHLLSLGLYIIGPTIVIGLPILETTSYLLSFSVRLLIALPLLIMAAWYTTLVIVLMRETVALFYEAPKSTSLADQLMISQRTRTIRSGIFVGAVWIFLVVLLYSLLRRFNLDIPFMFHFLPFIMAGSGLTMFVSAVSIVLATTLALFGALGRLSKNPIANGISGFYISLIRGTPLLVQIYIWYLGLPRLDIILSAVPAGILALSVNYGAYMTEIFRAGIQAVSKGQHEAAEAMGMSRAQTLRRIVLPQAFRIVIPPIGNEFIAMMKDSSLVSLMGVWELTFRAGKIGRQYFRNIETFIIAAAFYWILTVIFQFLQGNLETYMARGERR
ncbi:MAG: ABC transporter permease subunit, partial [Candidatus Thorarchaeota archaeon]